MTATFVVHGIDVKKSGKATAFGLEAAPGRCRQVMEVWLDSLTAVPGDTITVEVEGVNEFQGRLTLTGRKLISPHSVPLAAVAAPRK